MQHRFLRYSLAAVAAALIAVPASADPNQFMDPQDFDFPVDQSLVGQGDWIARGTATSPPLNVVAGALQYAPGGLEASTGNSVQMFNQTGESARLLWPEITPQDGNTYYWSALVEWDGNEVPDGSSYLGGFLVSDGANTTFFRGILRAEGDDGEVRLGVALSANNESIPGYAPTPLVANQPAFVVIKITEVPGVRNDEVDMFVFVNDPVTETEPATPDAVHTYDPGESSDMDIAVSNSGFGITAISLRQWQTGWPGNWRVDMVRAGSTWESVVPYEEPAPPPTSAVHQWSLYQ